MGEASSLAVHTPLAPYKRRVMPIAYDMGKGITPLESDPIPMHQSPHYSLSWKGTQLTELTASQMGPPHPV